MSTTHTIKVQGHHLRTATRRRYVIVSSRAAAILTESGWLVAFARAEGYSDSLASASKRAEKLQYKTGRGVYSSVVDLTTGSVVWGVK